MTIATILSEKGRHVVTTRPETSLRDAAIELMSHGIGALVVIDDERRLLGVFAERDLVIAVARQGSAALDAPVSEHMQDNCAPAEENDSVNDTMHVMTIERRRHIPVTCGGQLAGLVSIGDVVKYRLRVIEEEHRSMREYIAQG